MEWITYHIAEEYLIALICFLIAVRAFKSSRATRLTEEIKSRIFLIGSGFTLLGINSSVHAFIHGFQMNQNLLYQTLLGYCLGLLMLITAVSSEKPWNKKFLPLFYIPLLVLLHPNIYTIFPIFGKFRPLVWVFISYLSGLVCMLYIGVYYRTKAKKYLYSSLGHAFICTGAILLFFPASIGSTPWIYGHIFRPLGFIILFFSMQHEDLTKLTGSVLDTSPSKTPAVRSVCLHHSPCSFMVRSCCMKISTPSVLWEEMLLFLYFFSSPWHQR